MSTSGNWRVILKLESSIEVGEYTKKSGKNNKRNKRLQLQGEIREIRINYFTRKKNEM